LYVYFRSIVYCSGSVVCLWISSTKTGIFGMTSFVVAAERSVRIVYKMWKSICTYLSVVSFHADPRTVFSSIELSIVHWRWHILCIESAIYFCCLSSKNSFCSSSGISGANCSAYPCNSGKRVKDSRV